MRKDPEPLIELLYQEFPKTDPTEIERITKTVEKWLEQRLKDYNRMEKKVERKLGKRHISTAVTTGYCHCTEELLRELDPKKYPIHT